MVVKEVIKNRLDKLSLSLNKIERFYKLSYEAFLEDDIAQDVVEYNLFISINMMIDVATHIVVDNNIGTPKKLSDAFDILKKEKYINEIDVEIYKQMVGFRNILSHEYIRINKKIAHNIMKNNLKDFKKFILFIHNEFLA